MNKIKICFFCISAIVQFSQLKAIATVDGLKKLITKFADDEKSYITLCAAELGLDYNKHLEARRKQNSLEIKNYVLMFSPALTGEALGGKIDQDKLDWVNNICPGVLPKVPLTLATTPATEASAPAKPTENNSSSANTTTNTVAPTTVTQNPDTNNTFTTSNKGFKSFHALRN
jgi:hypothetical protein